MSRLNTECDVGQIDYNLRGEGRYAWLPSVNIRVGNGVSRLGTVRSIKATMDRYNWTDKVRSGRPPLVFAGNEKESGNVPYDPAHHRHWESLRVLTDVLRPRRTWLDTRGVYEPSSEMVGRIDYFSVHLTQNQVKNYREGNRDVWQWYATQARNQQNVDFIIESETVGIEDIIEDFSSNYKVPDDRIFMYPAGDSISVVNERFERMWDIAKSHQWSVSPRMEFLSDTGENES